MRVEVGDIWQADCDRLVIPTNIGWTKAGLNVMGRGLAKDAAMRFPSLPRIYGLACQMFVSRRVPEEETFLMDFESSLLLFPTKSFMPRAPWLSWKQPAKYELIRAGLEILHGFLPGASVAVPLLGCGNGELDPKIVFEDIDEVLGGDDRFMLVIPPFVASKNLWPLQD